MTKELDGKVALVTGATSGIGRETAILFAKAGAKVVVSGRREPEGNETLDLIRAAGGEGLFVQTDVSKASEVEALVSGCPSPNNPKKTGTAPSTSTSKASGSP
jgi:NAD(P)-dependent dehydrogenase (short-subunit alcohol dehydrogenase family)